MLLDIRKDYQIAVRKTAPRESDYDDFREDLMSKGDGECLYGIFDYNSPISRKLFVIMYTPECANLGRKTFFRRGFQALKALLKNVDKFIIAEDPSELCTDSLEEKLRNPDPSLNFPKPRRGRLN